MNKTAVASRRKVVLVLVAGGLVVLAVLAAIAIFKWIEPKSVDVPAEGMITVKGTTTCLPHKDTSGPQTMECAYGIKDEKGRYYALRDLDPTFKNISNLPMNNTVTIEGNFREETSDMYPTIGTLEISEVTR